MESTAAEVRVCEVELLTLLSLAPHEEPSPVFAVLITIGIVLIVTGRVTKRCVLG